MSHRHSLRREGVGGQGAWPVRDEGRGASKLVLGMTLLAQPCFGVTCYRLNVASSKFIC